MAQSRPAIKCQFEPNFLYLLISLSLSSHLSLPALFVLESCSKISQAAFRKSNHLSTAQRPPLQHQSSRQRHLSIQAGSLGTYAVVVRCGLDSVAAPGRTPELILR
jgi:hypothetical protein